MTIRTYATTLAFATLASASSAAVTFSNFSFNAEALAAGFTAPTPVGNSVTYQPANAFLVGAAAPTTYSFSYDATDAQELISGVSGLTQAFVGGGGTASYTLDVYDLIGGGLLGTQTVDAAADPSQFASLTFAGTSGVHVVSSITLTATSNFDFAAVAQTNESVQTVPEPTSMVALGLGAVAFLRRRRSISRS
jgi:hypothetical protein